MHIFVNPSCTPAPLNTWTFETQYNDVEMNYGQLSGDWGSQGGRRASLLIEPAA